MSYNREKALSELAAAGLDVRGFNSDGPTAGRLVLADGTVRTETGAVERGNASLVATANAVLAAHDPSETPAQRDRRRRSLRLEALALVVTDGLTAPQWARDLVSAMATRARGEP